MQKALERLRSLARLEERAIAIETQVMQSKTLAVAVETRAIVSETSETTNNLVSKFDGMTKGMSLFC